MTGWGLSIDFGTSFTTAAIQNDGRVEVLEVENSRYLPSLVYRDEEGTLLVGRAAVNSAEAFPERAARVPKRDMANGDRVLLDGHEVETADLVAAVLRKVRAEALRRLGGTPPARVILTHPARWGSVELSRLGEAARRAGLGRPDWVPEPVASAAWLGRRMSLGDRVAVYDLGGGTFDTAILRRGVSGFEVLATGGDPYLGGEDFDESAEGIIRAHAGLDEDGREWLGTLAGQSRAAIRARTQLRKDARMLKETLSEQTAFTLASGVRITRQEFTAAILKALTGAAAELLDTVNAAHLAPGDLAAVYLTGGSTRIPHVADTLAAALGRLPALENDPKAVVAMGAFSIGELPGKPDGPGAADRPTIAQKTRRGVALLVSSFFTVGPVGHTERVISRRLGKVAAKLIIIIATIVSLVFYPIFLIWLLSAVIFAIRRARRGRVGRGQSVVLESGGPVRRDQAAPRDVRPGGG